MIINWKKMSGLLVNDINNFTFQLGCLDCDWWYFHFQIGCLDQIIFSTVFDTSLDIKIFLPSFSLSWFSALDELVLEHDKFPSCLTLKRFFYFSALFVTLLFTFFHIECTGHILNSYVDTLFWPSCFTC